MTSRFSIHNGHLWPALLLQLVLGITNICRIHCLATSSLVRPGMILHLAMVRILVSQAQQILNCIVCLMFVAGRPISRQPSTYRDSSDRSRSIFLIADRHALHPQARLTGFYSDTIHCSCIPKLCMKARISTFPIVMLLNFYVRLPVLKPVDPISSVL